MPLLYDDVVVVPQGILTVQSFSPPRNGRTVKFSLPNGYDRKCVYTCIDGIYSGPFGRAVPIETEIRGLELLKIDSHSANVIVIDTSETVLRPISLKIPPVTVTLSSGEKVAVYINGTVNVSIRVRDSEALLEDYRDNGITSAEFRAESVIQECFSRRVQQRIQEQVRFCQDMNGLSVLDVLSEDIRYEACQDAENYPKCPAWFQILTCSLDLASSNFDEIVEKENYNWKMQDEEERIRRRNDEAIRVKTEEARIKMAEKTANALIQVYQREAIPKEMAKLLAAYVQSNPQVSPTELVSVCEKLRELSRAYSFDTLLQKAGTLGLLPDNFRK